MLFGAKPQVVKMGADLGALASELTSLRVQPQPPASTRAATRESHQPPAPDLKEALYEAEKAIGRYKLSWIPAGAALKDVADRALYRWKNDSFEEYLKTRWGLKKRTAYDLITAAGVAENVRAVKHTLTAAAALKLAKLPAEQQAECLSRVIASSGTRSPKVSQVAAAVAALLPARQQRATKKTKKPKPVRLRLATGTLTILAKHAGIDLRALLEEALAQLAKPAAA